MTPILLTMLITLPLIALGTWAYWCHPSSFRRIGERIKPMRWALQHPIWSGFSFEAILVGLFMLFPVGSCNAPVPGVVVVFLHYPALLFVERVLGIAFSAQQALLAAALTVPIWIGMLLAIRRIRRARIQGVTE